MNLIRNQLVNMRRTIWPQRDAIGTLATGENEMIQPEVRTYLRDTHDHCVQTSEVVEMYRDMATGLLNTYLSSVAHRSNEVMKVLTIMSSIFVPTDVSGRHLWHELRVHAGTFFPLGISGGLDGHADHGRSMLWFFWRKGWIGMARLQETKRTVHAVRSTASDHGFLTDRDQSSDERPTPREHPSA